MSFKTADMSDDLHPQPQYLEPIFSAYGGKDRMSGEIVTVKCHEDNSKVKEMLGTPGEGKILVVDAGGSKRCAMLGDMIAANAVKHQWAGVLMYGMIRDSEDIATMDLGVWALGTFPLKSEKLGVGEVNKPVHFAGAHIKPGQYLYADADGIIILDKPYETA